MSEEAKKDSPENPVRKPFGRKRRVPRREVHMRIGLLVAGRYQLTHAFELGEGGLLVSSSEPLSVSQKVVVTFRIPNVLHNVLMATVVYAMHPKSEGDPPLYGLRFDNLDFSTKRKIRQFVATSTDSGIVLKAS